MGHVTSSGNNSLRLPELIPVRFASVGGQPRLVKVVLSESTSLALLSQSIPSSRGGAREGNINQAQRGATGSSLLGYR